MLRAAVKNKTEVGLKAKAAMAAGALVSDEIVIGIIKDRIAEKVSRECVLRARMRVRVLSVCCPREQTEHLPMTTSQDCDHGFILDGFPRTVPQAKALDKMLSATGEKVTAVVELRIPDSELEKRICGRWIHKASGRSYHATYAPAMPASLKGAQVKDSSATACAENMKDDVTGEQ